MAKSILIRHKESGIVKKGVYGFSFTYFFFGFFVPLFRDEIGVAVLHILFQIFSFGLSHLIFSFIYNRQYMTKMLLNGWELAGSEAENTMARSTLWITERNNPLLNKE